MNSHAASPPHHDGLSISIRNGVLHIQIDRPDRLNAVTLEVTQALARVFETTARSADVRAVVLSGLPKAFCAGADLQDPPEAGSDPSPELIDAANRVVAAIRECPSVVVAAVSGAAVGVGVSFALACDYVVSARSAYFLLSFTNIGLMPDGGATALVAAAVGRMRALKMALRAEPVTADAALDWGLVSDVVDDEDVIAVADDIAARFAASSTSALAATKSAINESALPDLAGALARERRGQLELLSGDDFQEGLSAFLAKRKPNYRSR